ncbi:hypothetical protein Gekk315_00060 [Aeromonas phage Gekk3-15]
MQDESAQYNIGPQIDVDGIKGIWPKVALNTRGASLHVESDCQKYSAKFWLKHDSARNILHDISAKFILHRDSPPRQDETVFTFQSNPKGITVTVDVFEGWISFHLPQAAWRHLNGLPTSVEGTSHG